MPHSLRQRFMMLTLVLLGLSMMLLQAHRFDGYSMGDPVEYANEAWTIVHGPQPDTWRARTRLPMLMPIILAGPLSLTGSLFWMRVTVSLFGAATIWLTYLLAARLIDESAGLVAMAILATNPLWSSMSSQLFSEVPATFFLMLSLLLLSGARSPKNLFAAGCALGAAALVRYQAGALLLPIGGLLLWQFERRQTVAFCVGLGLILSVQVLHDRAVQSQLWHSLQATLEMDLSGKAGIHNGRSPWWYYLRHLHHWLGIAGPLALVIGGWTAWRRGRRFGFLLLALPVIFLITALSFKPHKELRFLVLVTPVAAILCSATLHLVTQPSNWTRNIAPVLILAAMPLLGTYRSLNGEKRGFYTGQADGVRYLERHHPGTLVVTPSWSLCLPTTSGTLQVRDLRLESDDNLGQQLQRADFVLTPDALLDTPRIRKLLEGRFKLLKRFPSRNETYLLMAAR